ncbi:glycosyltransferase family 4 protein [Prosthecobacter sp. SYSU 5D2]|uniref:glycosyltransferase family 4 protein n=1 Tax=Prosthecobacter sp. SYSU 5D2 TaxID=3134134 RepID=UPI0031FE5150
MKLALIRRQYAATGGAELYLQRLITGLVEAGHDVHLYAQEWQGAPAAVTLHPVAVRAPRALRPVRFAELVAQRIAPLDYDVVFSLERTVYQDVYRAGDGVHKRWLDQRRRYATWWRRPFIGMGAFHSSMMALEKRTFDPAVTRRIIVNSDMVRQEILSEFGFPADRIHLVRNGVETARFQKGDRTATRQRFGLAESDFVLLFVGSGWERKGLHFLLRLMQRLEKTDPQVKLLVIGKGHLRSVTPANVILAGPMPQVENAYAAADLLTFLPIYEPSSNVVPEALAAGLPVITSIFNGAAEWLTEGVNGHVLPAPEDTDALETAVRHWMARPHARPVPCAHPLDLETNVRETLRVLEILAAEKTATRA